MSQNKISLRFLCMLSQNLFLSKKFRLLLQDYIKVKIKKKTKQKYFSLNIIQNYYWFMTKKAEQISN